MILKSATAGETCLIAKEMYQKYRKVNIYKNHERVDTTLLPYSFFLDLKHFLKKDDMVTVKVLVSVLAEISIKAPKTVEAHRELKNALMIFTTLIFQTSVDVMGWDEFRYSAFKRTVEIIECADDSFDYKAELLSRYGQLFFRKSEEKPNKIKCLLIKDAVGIINRHFREQIKLSDVSSILAVSESHLSRMFKKEMNLSFSEYVTSLRIEESKTLLMHTELPIHEIAYLVGYNYQNHYASSFRKHTGMTPTEFKEQMRSAESGNVFISPIETYLFSPFS